MRNKFLNSGQSGYHPVKKIKVVLKGLWFALITDFSVLYKLIISIIICVPVFIFNSLLDASVIILATAVMLAAELFNTAIEAICDFLDSNYNEKIGIIKDISAAATGIIILAWLIVLIIELIEIIPHFIKNS